MAESGLRRRRFSPSGESCDVSLKSSDYLAPPGIEAPGMRPPRCQGSFFESYIAYLKLIQLIEHGIPIYHSKFG